MLPVFTFTTLVMSSCWDLAVANSEPGFGPFQQIIPSNIANTKGSLGLVHPNAKTETMPWVPEGWNEPELLSPDRVADKSQMLPTMEFPSMGPATLTTPVPYIQTEPPRTAFQPPSYHQNFQPWIMNMAPQKNIFAQPPSSNYMGQLPSVNNFGGFKTANVKSHSFPAQNGNPFLQSPYLSPMTGGRGNWPIANNIRSIFAGMNSRPFFG